jgi:hypothetical protein
VIRVGSERQALDLFEEIVDRDRKYPLVGLTCRPGKRDPAMPVEQVRQRIWPNVPIYLIEPRESRTLNSLLTEELGADDFGAYNGAGRVWWPGVDKDALPSWHPLIYDDTKRYGEETLGRMAAEFSRVPESMQELSPREQTALRLRSVPRPPAASAHAEPAPVVPVATRRDLRRLAGELRRADRETPIVVLTLGENADEPVFNPGAVRSAVDPHIPVYVLGNSDLCRRLDHALGTDLAVHDGDARIYWTGVNGQSDPAEHPLVSVSVEGDMREPAVRLRAALDLSRPPVRGQLTGTRERLQAAKQRASDTARQLRESQDEARTLRSRLERTAADLVDARQRLAALEAAGLDAAEIDLIGRMDTDARLHRLISREWQRALPSGEDRKRFPLGGYTFGERFIKSVEELRDTPAERIGWVCAMVASGRANEMPGLQTHQSRDSWAGSDSRTDSAKAWTCRLREGASRLLYWVKVDGRVEFAMVTKRPAPERG